MAAFDTPWLDQMSGTPSSRKDDHGGSLTPNDPNPPTIAAFSPVTLSHAPSANKQRSTILVHEKSPLLLATPPQITRALAYSHPFLLPLNKLAGLITWTSGDPWESFLLVASFWAVVLYGHVVMRFAGPVVVVIALILGMYSRRYSPLSSTSWTGEKQQKGHKRNDSEFTNTKHQKTLDEIVDTLKVFTSRCNVLLDPLLQLTDFLSTQRTATSATTRPALTTLLIRILLVTPVWIILTLPPLQVITTKRIALVTGTIFLTWHSRPNRIARTILWRSSLVRHICTAMTGLHLTDELSPTGKGTNGAPPLPPRTASSYRDASLAADAAKRSRPEAPGVKFTFILYENQRRWVGLGWTTSLFAYERTAWTDEHLNPVPPKEEFELPDVEGGGARWRWVGGSHWRVEGAAEHDEGGPKPKAESDGGTGWIYYDNKWQNGRRGQDGWGRYTRRRKWYRDAELVEITSSTEVTPSRTPTHASPSADSNSIRGRLSSFSNPGSGSRSPPPDYDGEERDDASVKSNRSSRFGGGTSGRGSKKSSLKKEHLGMASGSRKSSVSLEDEGEDERQFNRPRATDWGISDDARMGLE